MGNGAGRNRANVAALGRLRNRPAGLTSAVGRARVNARRARGGQAGGTFNAVARLRRRPAGLTEAAGRAQRNARRRARAR